MPALWQLWCRTRRQLLAVLSDRERETLVLRVALGLSAAETAQAVQSTPRAVRVGA